MVSISFGGGTFGVMGHTGSCPQPFDALNGYRLAGPQGSHPLHAVRLDELVRPSSDGVTGEMVLDHPVRVGEGIDGRLRLMANRPINARKAALRLVGLRLVEETKSQTHDEGEHSRTEHWVEANGSLFVQDAFVSPVIPPSLVPGEVFETTFSVPAPRLGPPSAHLGEAIVAWAIDVRWDVAMGADEFLAMPLAVAQHPDLIRAGVGRQGGMAVMDVVDVGGATIAVAGRLPGEPGTALDVTVNWPGAPGGEGRIELHRRTNAPNGQEGILASAATDSGALQAGSARALLAIPMGVAPSFDGAGLENGYVIRVLINRRFRPDTAIERPVAIA